MEYTYEDLLPHFRAIVAEEGEDFIYPTRVADNTKCAGCYYQWEGQPDCGVGRVLNRIGVPVSTLEGMDFSGSTIEDQYSTLYAIHSITFTPKARVLMESFQFDQDDRATWGEALREAIKAAERI